VSTQIRQRNLRTGQNAASTSLSQLWIDAGGTPKIANIMAAIAMAESSGIVSNVGGPNSNGTYDYGLWQINSSHTQFNRSLLLSDPLYNARAAVAIYRSQGLTAWSTYNNGAYQGFLSGAAGADYTGAKATPRTRPGGQPAGTKASGTDVTAILSNWSTQEDNAGKQTGVQTTGLFSGIPILKDIPGIDSIPNPLDLFSGLSSGVNDVVDFLKILAWILNPANILRMVEFLFGVALMGFGLQAALQARGEKLEGFQTSEGALTRSGLGRVSQELASTINRAVPEGRAASLARRHSTTAPHRTRRQALRLRYEREKAVSQRRATQRRQGTGQ
jgi:Lysozyme like domain